MIVVPIFNNGLYPINYMCNVTLNRYHAEIYFFPITCATEFFGVFFAKKSLFRHFSGFKKHCVAFSKNAYTCFGRVIQVCISLRFVSKHH